MSNNRQLNEYASNSAYEKYAAIILDPDKNAFKILKGLFHDKKEVYEKMRQRGIVCRKVLESRILDWCLQNAKSVFDAYLMLSTAFSKWRGNNILSDYYVKLLNDLPKINREKRKGDPQSIGDTGGWYKESVLKEDDEENEEDSLIDDYDTLNKLFGNSSDEEENSKENEEKDDTYNPLYRDERKFKKLNANQKDYVSNYNVKVYPFLDKAENADGTGKHIYTLLDKVSNGFDLDANITDHEVEKNKTQDIDFLYNLYDFSTDEVYDIYPEYEEHNSKYPEIDKENKAKRYNFAFLISNNDKNKKGKLQSITPDEYETISTHKFTKDQLETFAKINGLLFLDKSKINATAIGYSNSNNIISDKSRYGTQYQKLIDDLQKLKDQKKKLEDQGSLTPELEKRYNETLAYKGRQLNRLNKDEHVIDIFEEYLESLENKRKDIPNEMYKIYNSSKRLGNKELLQLVKSLDFSSKLEGEIEKGHQVLTRYENIIAQINKVHNENLPDELKNKDKAFYTVEDDLAFKNWVEDRRKRLSDLVFERKMIEAEAKLLTKNRTPHEILQSFNRILSKNVSVGNPKHNSSDFNFYAEVDNRSDALKAAKNILNRETHKSKDDQNTVLINGLKKILNVKDKKQYSDEEKHLINNNLSKFNQNKSDENLAMELGGLKNPLDKIAFGMVKRSKNPVNVSKLNDAKLQLYNEKLKEISKTEKSEPIEATNKFFADNSNKSEISHRLKEIYKDLVSKSSMNDHGKEEPVQVERPYKQNRRSVEDYINNEYRKSQENLRDEYHIQKILDALGIKDKEDSSKKESVQVNDGASWLYNTQPRGQNLIGTIEEETTKNTLNQKFFNGNDLREEVRQALLKIADKFKNELDLPFEPVDIYFTGSCANYNYNEYSDIDLHLVYDFEEAGVNAEILSNYLFSAKKVFNDKYDIKIKGYPVELGAENQAEPLVSSGVYSLVQNKWIKEPNKANTEIQEPDAPFYQKIVNDIEEAIQSNDSKIIGDMWKELAQLRKISLADEGEFGPGNTLFKTLRNKKYLERLKDAYYNSESDRLSLESLEEIQ